MMMYLGLWNNQIRSYKC